MTKNKISNLDRTKVPETGQVEFNGFPDYQTGKLSNGIPWYGFHHDDLSVLRIDFVIPGGSWIQNRFFQAMTTARMLLEGAGGKSAFEIAENIDFLGAYADSSSGNHTITVSAYVLRNKFREMMQLFRLIMTKPDFPERELRVMMLNLKQEFIVGSQKVSMLARRKYPSLVFGKKHPYGKYPGLDDFDKISRKELTEYYDLISFADMKIYIGGYMDQELIQTLEEEMGQVDFSRVYNEVFDFPQERSNAFRHHIEKENAVQTAIMIGKDVLNRDSEDYPLLTLAVTVLGGYFGSRLMSKIREEKGLTYGIFSSVQAKPKGSYFAIQSEVIAERTQEAIDEIFSEIMRLSDEAMDQGELELVRNYSMGGIMRSFDGPFQLVDRLKLAHAYNLDAKTYYSHIVADLHKASTEDIARIVKEQLNPEKMYVLTAGAK